jgi:hypothetical protein
MIRTLIAVLFVCLVTGNTRLSAQCFDSTQVQIGAYCDPRWEPVCGCDGFTYTTECFARNAGIITYYQGICDPVDFSFYPNPPYDHLEIDAMLRVPGTMYVEMTDCFGNIFYQNVFPNVQRFQFQIQTKGFPVGVYFLNIYCNDGFRVKKVVVPGLP